MYLDYAELMARNHKEMHMAEWETKLGEFLQFNGQDVLKDSGKVKRSVADALALKEYEKFDNHRKLIESSDIEELNSNIKKLK